MPVGNLLKMPPLHLVHARVARALGVALPTGGSAGIVRSLRDVEIMATDNGTSRECWQNCTSPCLNTTAPCLCPCEENLHSDPPSLGAAFASVSFLFFLVATIQLILCMAHDALQVRHTTNTATSRTAQDERWRKAFRLTVQKSLLGAVIGATGTRAIYYTVQGYIEEKWAEILLHVYYPALLSAFSLLILFWAEIFYQSTAPSENHVFLKKHKYSLAFLSFNGLVYLLFLAEVVATPLVRDDSEQVRKSGIIGIIFAVLLLLMLVGFLHLAIRLFFRPDWQPLVLQLEALKINLKQHTLSCLGIVTNAFMQALIISLLVFNMVSRLEPVDHYSQYVASLIIRVTELVMPVWFCCSLWNYKKPTSLWILNPGLLIQQLDLRGTERERLIQNRDSSRHNPTTYGTIEGCQESHSEDGYCWVCHDRSPTGDLIQPCRCLLHHQCIQRWVEHRVLNPEVSKTEALKCQVCREKYYTKKRRWTCMPQGLSRRHWVKVLGVLGFLVLTGLVSVYVLVYAHVSSGVKVAIVVILVLADATLLKLLGCGLLWLGRRHRVAVGEITTRPSDLPFSHGNHLPSPSDDVITQTTPTPTQATPTGTFPNDITRQATPPTTGETPSNSTHPLSISLDAHIDVDTQTVVYA